MALQPGQVLNNRYRIVRLLGQGGFGAVYRAWDVNLNRPCAVKENLDTSPEAQRQFTREATILANLSHPNLPRVTDHFILPGQGQYLVMDFVEGEDLATLIKRQKTVSPRQAVGWITQVADALTYLHGRQPPVVHRDIKPANIRITPEGQAMLVDFGLVKVFSPSMRTTLGARAVTPGYAPPEQYGQGNTDARTDLYALGATLYNLLTGVEPMESVQRMAGGKMQLAHEVNPIIAPSVSEAIERVMRLDPNQRFQYAVDFKNALISSSEQMMVWPSQPAEPAEAARPGSGPRQPAPYLGASNIPATQVMPAGPAPAARGSAPAYPGLQTPSSSPVYSPAVLEQRPSSRNRACIWVVVLALVAICVVGGGGFMWMVNEQMQLDAQLTSDAHLLLTQTAQSQATAMTKLHLTQTAEAAAIEAQRQATRQALDGYLAGIDASKIQVFGPASGSLVHNSGNKLIESYDSNVNLANFVVQSRIFNPYAIDVGSWDYGLVVRHAGKDEQYRLVIKSDKEWLLMNNTGSADGTIIAEGLLPQLDTGDGGSNMVKLIMQVGRGMFFLNDELIAEFDVSARMSAGDIMVASGMYQGDEVDGYTTSFSEFTIWSIP